MSVHVLNVIFFFVHVCPKLVIRSARIICTLGNSSKHSNNSSSHKHPKTYRHKRSPSSNCYFICNRQHNEEINKKNCLCKFSAAPLQFVFFFEGGLSVKFNTHYSHPLWAIRQQTPRFPANTTASFTKHSGLFCHFPMPERHLYCKPGISRAVRNHAQKKIYMSLNFARAQLNLNVLSKTIAISLFIDSSSRFSFNTLIVPPIVQHLPLKVYQNSRTSNDQD